MLYRRTNSAAYDRMVAAGSVFAKVASDDEIAEPLRGASLVGNGAQDLRNIVGVAGDLSLGQGMCGSVSGSLPTDVGQPHILISEITVGGRA